MRLSRAVAACLALFAGLAGSAQAELILTAAPRGTEAEERALYEPLAKALSGWLNEKVVYEHPKDYTTYSFRMRNLQHEPLVKLPGKLAFLIVTAADNTTVTDLDSLIGKRICGLASPNFGTLMAMALYPNPVRQPVLLSVRGGFKDSWNSFKQGKCVAVIVRDEFYLKLSDADRASVRVVQNTRPAPNQTLTVGPKINAAKRAELVARLTSAEGAAASDKLFEVHSKKQKQWETAQADEYEGLDLILQDMSWGW